LVSYNESLQKTFSGLYYGMIKSLIQEKLQNDIYRGQKKRNYLLTIDSPALKTDLMDLRLPYLSFEGNFVYVTPMTGQNAINEA